MVFEEGLLKDFGFIIIAIFEHESHLNIGIVIFLIFFVFSVPSSQHSLQLITYILNEQHGCSDVIQTYLGPHPPLLIHHLTFLLSPDALDPEIAASMVGPFPHGLINK